MNICDKATNLILELKRNRSLPVYNSALIQDIIREIEECVAVIEELLKTPDNSLPSRGPKLEVRMGLEVHVNLISRNRRCVLAYLHHRFAKLREIWWETGLSIPEELRDCLGVTEASLIDKYDEIIGNYSREVGLDLRSDQMPPKDLYIEVCATTDLGEIVTESGSIQIKKGSRQLMRRTDCELLIRNGSLEQIVRD